MTCLLFILVKEDTKDKSSSNRHIYTKSFFLTHDYPRTFFQQKFLLD